MPNIKLQSLDGGVFDVDVEVVKASETLNTLLDVLGVVEGETIPVPKVESTILEKVLQWATHHRNDPPRREEEEEDLRTDNIPDWDVNFLADLDQSTLFELLQAAVYLDMRGLIDVTAKTVANMIKGKTPEQIRQRFNIRNDFVTTEEKPEEVPEEEAMGCSTRSKKNRPAEVRRGPAQEEPVKKKKKSAPRSNSKS